MKLTADQVPGNRLRIQQPVGVYIGVPFSGEYDEVWQPGYLSPPVYSWVERDGQLYWIIGELPPYRYVHHSEGALDIEADYGGGKYLNPPEESDKWGVGGLLDLLTLKNLTRAVKLAGVTVLGYIAFRTFK